jgi:hypothetical protein
MEALQALYYEECRGHPKRPSPVAVTAKHAAQRIARPVFDAEVFSVDGHLEWVFPMIPRKPSRQSVSSSRLLKEVTIARSRSDSVRA